MTKKLYLRSIRIKKNENIKKMSRSYRKTDNSPYTELRGIYLSV